MGERLSALHGIDVRCYRGAKIENLIELFTCGFVPEHWESVDKLLLLVGTNNLKKTEIGKFEKKFQALLNIIRARLGDVNFIVCTIPPRPKDFKWFNAKLIEFNFAIKRASIKAKAILHPLHRAFLYKGKPKLAYYCDGLHFSAWGTEIVTNVVKMYRARNN